LLVSGHFDFEEGTQLIKKLNETGLELAKILYEPVFRSIRGLLPRDHAEMVWGLKPTAVL